MTKAKTTFEDEVVFEEVYPRGEELCAVINEARIKIILKLYAIEHFNNKVVALIANREKDFQEGLNLYEVHIPMVFPPTLLVSQSAFNEAFQRAKSECLIFVKRMVIKKVLKGEKHSHSLSLTEKGRENAKKIIENMSRDYGVSVKTVLYRIYSDELF